MQSATLATIRFYQRWISPLTAPRCRFEPSCSSYMLEAVERFGLIKGGAIGIRRLLRCHPWHEAGYDPCPSAGTTDGSVETNPIKINKNPNPASSRNPGQR